MRARASVRAHEVHAAPPRSGIPLVAEWLENCAYRDLAEATRDSYECSVAELILWRDLDLAEFTAWDLEAFLAQKNASSRRKHKAAFASLWRFARKRGYVPENVVELIDDVRRQPQKIIDTFSDGEVERICGFPSPDGPLATILLFTGIRLDEARTLQRSAIVLDPVDDDEAIVRSGHLVVVGKGRKERIVPFKARVAQAVRELDTPPLDPSDYIWGSRLYDPPRRDRPIAKSTFHRWWAGGPAQRGVCEKAGVRYRNIHVTRHTFATRYLRRGGRIENLRRLLGHRYSQTTLDYYEHLSAADVSSDLELLEA